MNENEPPKVIYLIPESETEFVWCDDPAPGLGMDEEDAIKYIRADQLETLEAQNKALFAVLERLGSRDNIVDATPLATISDFIEERIARIKYANTESKRIEGMYEDNYRAEWLLELKYRKEAEDRQEGK